nr:MAG TPA: hypothetical protein [Caudoviricetes sp.]
MGSYDEDNVKMRRKLVDESLRVELKLKSIIIGIIILLATVYFVPSVKLLSTISVIYLAICLIDIYGIITRYKIMKLYDEDDAIKIAMNLVYLSDEPYTDIVSFNTLIYVGLNYGTLQLLIYLFN